MSDDFEPSAAFERQERLTDAERKAVARVLVILGVAIICGFGLLYYIGG